MKEKFLNAMQDKDFSELFKKGGVSFLIRIGGQIIGFLLTFVIAHYYGAQGLGNYVLAIVILQIFTLMSKLGLDTFSIRFIASFSKINRWKSIQLFMKFALLLMVMKKLYKQRFF